MICRRGGIDKHDIGAIRIYHAHTEFEISAQAAERFSLKLKGPDKDNHIRIEPLLVGEQGEGPPEKQIGKPGAVSESLPSGTRQDDKARHHGSPANHGVRSGKGSAEFSKKPEFDKKRRNEHRAAYAGQARREDATPFAKGAFAKKPRKKKYRG